MCVCDGGGGGKSHFIPLRGHPLDTLLVSQVCIRAVTGRLSFKSKLEKFVFATKFLIELEQNTSNSCLSKVFIWYFKSRLIAVLLL